MEKNGRKPTNREIRRAEPGYLVIVEGLDKEGAEELQWLLPNWGYNGISLTGLEPGDELYLRAAERCEHGKQ